ncbi:four helix bundle protein [Candidatus Parcubacteria bacterium]|nr:four helix bundle protein [Candidatus Parcubacteria bacterium]
MDYINYKQSQAWREGINLIPHINRLSEDLPDGEQAGLAAELRRTAIDIPTAIAVDALAGGEPRWEFVCRLETQLELIRRVYPALDTGDVENGLEQLAERLRSERFADLAAPEAAADRPEADAEAAEPETVGEDEDGGEADPDATEVPVNETEAGS